MMRKLLALLPCLILPLAAAAGSEPPVDHLAPLRFLVGGCWQATFPDGKNVDTHCFQAMYGDAFIRDIHVVRGENPDYRGESIYQWDSEAGKISYRYWNSLGGVSDGTAIADGSRILFPGERHTREDGSVVEMQSVIEALPSGKYLSLTEQKTESGWKEMWRMEFTRTGPVTELGPAGRQQAEQLAALNRLVGNWANPARVAEAEKAGTPVPLQQSYRWGPRKMLLRVYEGLDQPFQADVFDPVLEGMVLWNHSRQGFDFVASSRFGWTFEGGYRVLENGAIERVYNVHYAEGEEYMPEPELAGHVRRFREIYHFEDDVHARISLDIWKNGEWTPFGPGEYRAVRVGG